MRIFSSFAGISSRINRYSPPFGSSWTEEKLERIRKYLSAYTTIMRKHNFKYAYIDAFAGTGYRELKDGEELGQLLLPEL